MAIRYSGDTEIRLQWDAEKRAYVGTVRDPSLHWRGSTPGKKPQNSEDYDDAAYRLFALATAWAKTKRERFEADTKDGKLRLRRVFQAPCPLPPERKWT